MKQKTKNDCTINSSEKLSNKLKNACGNFSKGSIKRRNAIKEKFTLSESSIDQSGISEPENVTTRDEVNISFDEIEKKIFNAETLLNISSYSSRRNKFNKRNKESSGYDKQELLNNKNGSVASVSGKVGSVREKKAKNIKDKADHKGTDGEHSKGAPHSIFLLKKPQKILKSNINDNYNNTSSSKNKTINKNAKLTNSKTSDVTASSNSKDSKSCIRKPEKEFRSKLRSTLLKDNSCSKLDKGFIQESKATKSSTSKSKLKKNSRASKETKGSTSNRMLKKNFSPKSKGSDRVTKAETPGASKTLSSSTSKADDPDSNSDASDWEEVDELNEIMSSNKREAATSGGVQIEIESKDLLWRTRRKRRSHQEMIEDYLRKEINKSTRILQENIHKVHVLCLFAHGIYLNSVIGQDSLLSSALSLIPKNYFSPKRLDVTHLEKFLSWFVKHITLKGDEDSKNICNLPFENILQKRFEEKRANSNKELVIMFVITARAIGMMTRLIQSLVPVSWKPPTEFIVKPSKQGLFSESSSQSNSSSSTLSQKTSSKLPMDSELERQPEETKLKTYKVVENLCEDEDFKNFDEDFEKFMKGRKSQLPTKRRSSEDMTKGKKPKKEPLIEWAEVFVEEEERWISVDVVRNKIHCTSEIEARSPNMSYVVAFNPDQSVKDVTRRYLSNWLSVKRKIRCDEDWWAKALRPFAGKKTRRDKEENQQLEKCLLMQPLPKTIAEYKNHPLYALQRHLLKFEAIYPPDASPVGFFKNEPVFPRETVKNLFGRESWLKEAKTVRVGEEPYKVVKARPKWDRNTYQLIKDRPLELFGAWQVEDYEPPVAKNGKVPRNEFGNVYLFKPSMVPRGCVHVPVNGLNKIARKLNIDCAPAVVGFDFRSWGCHPLYNGFVVCEEYKDVLLDAWTQEQINQAKREEEKRLRNIYDNWKKLIRGIVLKDRLREKYGGVVVEEKSKRNAKKKIKQKHLDELPSSTITHSLPNIHIDMNSSVTDNIRQNLKRNPKTSIKQDSQNPQAPSRGYSDSEDEISVKDKQQKIRNILEWNPQTKGAVYPQPDLSDQSHDEENSASSDVSKSKSAYKRKGTPAGKGNGKRVKNIWKREELPEVKALEADGEIKAMPVRRLRDRNKSKVNYKDGDDTASDVSVFDSDTGDKTYDPSRDAKKSAAFGLDLSEESD